MNSPNGFSGRIVSGPDSSNALCSERTGVLDLLARDDAADLDRRGRDHLDVDALRAEGAEDLRGDAGCDFMPAPTIETLPIVSSADSSRMPTSAMSGSSARARGEVVARDGERDLGGHVAHRLVLDDHVDVDVRVGEDGEDAPHRAGHVGHAEQRDPGLPGRVRHGGDEGLLHGRVVSDDNGTGTVVERRSAVDRHAVVAGVLDRAQLQDARARGGHLEHLLEGDDRQLARVGDDPRVGGEHAVDVGVDLADLGADGGGEGDRGRVRAAAAERRDVARGRHALEAGDQHDRALAERLADAIGADVEDAAFVCDVSVTIPACDPVREIARCPRSLIAIAHSAHDTARPSRGACPSRGVGRRGDLEGVGDQPVGLLAARREHGDDVVTLLALLDDPLRRALEALGVGHRRAAELHHHGLGHGG
jgi:hypothetical protein